MQDLSKKHMVLIVENNVGKLTSLKKSIEGENIEVKIATSVTEGIEAVTIWPISLVVLKMSLRSSEDQTLSGMDPFDGKPVLDSCKEKDPLIPVIAISEAPTIDIANIALSNGADSFFFQREPLCHEVLVSHISWGSKTSERSRARVCAVCG